VLQRISKQSRTISRSLDLGPLRSTLKFFVIYVLLTPSFKDYLDYFYNFDPTWDALVEIIVFLGVLVATIIYSVYLEDSET